MMETVRIVKVNDSTSYIDCSESAAKELSEHLTFIVPGHRFMPRYKAGIWDGTIKLFNVNSPYIQTGLVPRAIQFFSKSGYKIDLDGKITRSFLDSSIDNDKVFEWINSIDLVDELGEKIEPFDHQTDAVCAMIKHKRLVLLSPTSSGKSLIIFLTTKWRLENSDKKILIIVPTQQLVEQMHRDLSAYSKSDPIQIHKIYSGHSKKFDERVVVSTWQSIYKLEESWFDQFGTIFLDEGHMASGKCISSMLERCSKCEYRYALTGTLDGSKSHQYVIEGTFGPVKRFVSTYDLISLGVNARLTIHNVMFNYSEDIVNEFWKVTKGEFKEQLKFTYKLEERNKAIARMISRLENNSLVLFTEKDHGKSILPFIEEECLKTGKKVFMKTGENPLDERLEVSRIMESEQNIVFLATFGILSTGVSIKNINHVVFITTVKSRIRVLQSIGRGLRVSKTKDSVTLWEIIDNFSQTTSKGKHKTNKAVEHFLHRAEIYEKERFSTKTIEVEIQRRTV